MPEPTPTPGAVALIPGSLIVVYPMTVFLALGIVLPVTVWYEWLHSAFCFSLVRACSITSRVWIPSRHPTSPSLSLGAGSFTFPLAFCASCDRVEHILCNLVAVDQAELIMVDLRAKRHPHLLSGRLIRSRWGSSASSRRWGGGDFRSHRASGRAAEQTSGRCGPRRGAAWPCLLDTVVRRNAASSRTRRRERARPRLHFPEPCLERGGCHSSPLRAVGPWDASRVQFCGMPI